MGKSLLVGNGFTSQLISGYKSSKLMEKAKALIPEEIQKLELFFQPFRSLREFGKVDVALDINNLMNQYSELGEIDDEDALIGFAPTPQYGECLPREAYEKYDHIIDTKYPYLSQIKRSLFKRYFLDAKLFNETNNDSIISIEAPIMIARLAQRAGYITKEQEIKIRHSIKHVFFNGGTFRFADCKLSDYARRDKNGNICFAESPSREALYRFLKQFSSVFTTNYDLILDDLVYKKVRHLHGGFNFRSEYERIPLDQFSSVQASQAGYNIITAADGYDKSHYIYKHNTTLYSTYLKQLEEGFFSEIYILGYSGDNDEHINHAIKNNKNIQNIFIYVSPEEDRKNDNTIIKYGYRFCDNIGSANTVGNQEVTLLNWEDFWNRIKVKI